MLLVPSSTKVHHHAHTRILLHPPTCLPAALDQLIDMLMAAGNAEELTKRVAENIMSYDQRFWLRLATRSDTAPSEEDAAKLQSLARVVMQLVDAMVRTTNDQLSESAALLQTILRAAADDNGEWALPLPADRLAAMRRAMDENEAKLDEALLSNAFAWMRKASEDKLDGMVELLQKALQVGMGRCRARARGFRADSSLAAGVCKRRHAHPHVSLKPCR
jgi:hypothetical protein